MEISCQIANKYHLNFVEDIFTFLSMYNITCKIAFGGQDELQKTAVGLYGENTTIFHDDITKDIKHCFYHSLAMKTSFQVIERQIMAL